MSKGYLSPDELSALRAEIGESMSLEDAVLARGLVPPDVLERLLSLASTPLPLEDAPQVGVPDDRTATMWEYEVPRSEGEDDHEVSPDAVTGRFEGLQARTARLSGPVDFGDEPPPKVKSGRTTRWEIQIPADDPTSLWVLENPDSDEPPVDLSETQVEVPEDEQEERSG